MKILLIENDAVFANKVQHYLAYYQYEVIIRDTLILDQEFLCTPFPDVILINKIFINRNSLATIEHFNTLYPAIPIMIILSLNENVTPINFASGIYFNYLFKEHLLEELFCRIQLTTVQCPQKYYYYLSTDTSFNYLKRVLNIRNEKIILKPLEATIFFELCKNLNQITQRDILLKECWKKDDTYYYTSRYLDKYIVLLRKHLLKDPLLCIETIHRQGYCLLNKNEAPL